jgi:hypothetical protein
LVRVFREYELDSLPRYIPTITPVALRDCFCLFVVYETLRLKVGNMSDDFAVSGEETDCF